ncbi:MAG TPA: alpha/beta fold hydrolase, partial [Cyclobacteriaceae bacterium]|nr:alpha/beta fold hydrolase [Cyclobacteriaceae bacterium]
PFYDGDFFYLVNKGAQMPVSVRGNKASGIFILFIHGGPGGTSLQKIGLPAFNKLEESYAMVYWDQRASGSSQGNSSDKLLTLDQFVEDLDKLVDLIRHKYNNAEIFLMGHSWGGCLGTAYLADNDRQSKIRGWIEVDGAHDNPKGDSLSLSWVSDYAASQIKLSHEVDFWNYVLNWYAENPDFTSDQLEHYSFLEKAHGYIFDPDLPRSPRTFPEYSFDYLFNSPADVTAALTNYQHVIKHFIISDIDLTPQMRFITLPSLIVWGKHDGVEPYPMALQALKSLGTMDSNKSILTLNNSAHFGYYEEPEVFSQGIKSFIDKFK